MSRRSEWSAVREAIDGSQKMGDTIAARETMPEKACGTCQRFSENAKEADGRGICGVLKMGSNLTTTPPKLVLEGAVGLITYINTDGAHCTHYNRMTMIDKDGGETSDPVFRRAHRQMDKV
ncbi:MAG: hypothetical protein GY866_21645 [Proteobacteria bacterium]|nr:hypothetical protein [Pseudomonadota bacterium]